MKIAEKIFWTLSIVAFLVIVYVNTDDKLTPPALLSPILVLAFGYGIGGGMLFRTFARKEDNSSSVNYFMKLGVCALVLLSFTFSFLLSLVKIL